jgi:hypothetical protein
MKKALAVCGILAGTMLAITGVASATSADNSIQPSHLRFGDVTSGQHPVKVATLHNGTGAPQRIGTITIAGSGGYKFTLTGASTCSVGERLANGETCSFAVRVHTSALGWWRSVLRVTYSSGWNNSSSLQAHVVP